jgi:uncharacterized repeat protein (TIGR03943 family)
MTLSFRSARLTVLITWSALFLYLWWSNEVERYLGPRTAWVVPFGALALTAGTALYAALSKNGPDARRRLGWSEAAGTAAMLAPALMVVVLASASLGALAASRKLSSRGIDASRLSVVAKQTKVTRVSFLEIATASRHRGFGRANDIVPGRPIHLVGLVVGPGRTGAAPFRLGRFYITCCVADSIAIDSYVLPPANQPRFGRDKWLAVSGRLVRRHGDLAIRAESIDPVKQPRHPYLDFQG